MVNRIHIKIHVISLISNNMAITKQWVPREHQANQVKEVTREDKWVTCLRQKMENDLRKRNGKRTGIQEGVDPPS